MMKHGMRAIPAMLLGACAATAIAADTMMSIQVKEAPLRASPSFLGAVVAKAAYGDRVTVVEKKQAWVKVQAGPGASGWVHESAVTPKRIVMKSGETTAQAGASSEELALAGKGFNSDVEAQFKARSGAPDYEPVDRMERRTVSESEMAAFARAGGIGPAKGGAR